MSMTPNLKANAGAAPVGVHAATVAPSAATHWRRHLPALAVLAAIFAWLLGRTMGFMPTVFADEWYYSRLARLQPLAESILPSYLYLWIMRGTNLCGTNFLDCARGLNVLFWIGAAPFLYLTARAFVGRGMAAGLTLLALFAPLNLYTAYFMPECTYFFGFSVLSWVALTRRDWHWAVYALACGIVLGLMSLVKVHAVFLVPALCLFLLYARWLAGGAWLATGLAAMAIGGAATFAVRFGLGYLLAGAPALDLFGPFYGGAQHRTLAQMLAPAGTSLLGHLMVLCLISALPLAIVLQALLRPAARATATPADLLRVYALLTLGAAAGMTVMYTASIGVADAHEGLRLHLRYYSFMFPMLWLAAAAAPSAQEAQGKAAWLRWALALLAVGFVGLALFKLSDYPIIAVDSPEANAMRLTHTPGRVVAALEVLILLAWAMGKSWARPLFLATVLPILAGAGIVGNHMFLEPHRHPNARDQAGLYARDHIPAAEHDQVTVIGAYAEEHMRAQFHIDSAHTTTVELPGGAPVERWHLPVRNNWLLVIGQHALPEGLNVVGSTPESVLIHTPHNNRVLGRAILTEPFGKGLIASAEGLSGIEGFGRWTDGKRVVLHLNVTLPKRVNIIVRGYAFGDNATKPFQFHVGDASATFYVSYTLSEYGATLETDGTQRDLVIEIPHPHSPKDLGASEDARNLGLALSEIEISTPAD